MGEAKRRQDAAANGLPTRAPAYCPACSSRHISRLRAADDATVCKYFGADLELCADCGAIWEAFPSSGYVEDVVCAEPCDNCAFRPGSPEQADPKGWRALIDSLKPDPQGFFTSQFFCHKRVPIDLSKGPGNFLWPKTPVIIDGETVGSTEDTRRMRTCSGFLRMFWARIRKRPSPVGDEG